jgi:hypothetical protein
MQVGGGGGGGGGGGRARPGGGGAGATPPPPPTQRHRSTCENDQDQTLDLCFGVGQTRRFCNHRLKFAPTGFELRIRGVLLIKPNQFS